MLASSCRIRGINEPGISRYPRRGEIEERCGVRILRRISDTKRAGNALVRKKEVLGYVRISEHDPFGVYNDTAPAYRMEPAHKGRETENIDKRLSQRFRRHREARIDEALEVGRR